MDYFRLLRISDARGARRPPTSGACAATAAGPWTARMTAWTRPMVPSNGSGRLRGGMAQLIDVSCAAVATGDERSHAGSSGLRPQSGHRGEALHAATAPSQLTYRPPTGCPCKRCGLRCSTHCQLLEGKAKAVITTGALKTYYHTTCTSTRYPSHVHHVRLFTTRLCVQTIVDTVQSGFSFTRACCCSTMS